METMTKADVATADFAAELDTELDSVDRYFAAELTAQDRCDRCSAPAVSQVLVSEALSVMLLCGHHHRENRAGFIAKGYVYRAPADEDRIFLIGTPPLDNKARDAGSA